MDSQITIDDLKKIEAGIIEKYINVAKSPEGQFKYPTGKKGLEALHYDKTLIDELPTSVSSSYCGVGHPFSVGKINQISAVVRALIQFWLQKSWDRKVRSSVWISCLR